MHMKQYNINSNCPYNPDMDGINHINMYSNAKTAFGRLLSDFYREKIDTADGQFMSVEAYWYYLGLPNTTDREKLRNTYGAFAKKLGRELRSKAGLTEPIFDPEFESKITAAIEQKLKRHKDLFDPKYRDLPIVHYYIYGNKLFDVTDDFPWLLSFIRQIVAKIYSES